MLNALLHKANLTVILTSLLALGGVRGVAAEPAGEVIFRDDFNGKLGQGWSFEREERSNWRVGPAGLEVRVQPGNMWGGANNAKNVFVHPVPAPGDAPIEISVTISNSPTGQWEQANLVWFYDDSNMVKLGQELVTKRLSIVMGREENDRARTVAIVPLDANAVELRLQAVKNRVRGQFRTAPWSHWRDIGECDLPVKGEPKASLHFYNGPKEAEHWVKVNNFAVRRLSTASVDWPRVRAEEKVSRGSDPQRLEFGEINLPGGFSLLQCLTAVAAEPKVDYEQRTYSYKDGAYGWSWDRRASASKESTVAGVALGADGLWPMANKTKFQPVKVANVKTLELEMDAVTRLENDHGDHNFTVVLQMEGQRRIAIWFDWYGAGSEVQSLNDGYREYGFIENANAPNEIQYRIKGFRGAPPRVNLKAFVQDAMKRGVSAKGQLRGIWLGNEIWNGSRGATLVTKLDVVVDGKRYSSVGRP